MCEQQAQETPRCRALDRIVVGDVAGPRAGCARDMVAVEEYGEEIRAGSSRSGERPRMRTRPRFLDREHIMVRTPGIRDNTASGVPILGSLVTGKRIQVRRDTESALYLAASYSGAVLVEGWAISARGSSWN